MAYQTLANHLAASIRSRGPISLAAFMRDALMHPTGGYYVQREAIGRHGDFVTAPEVSQVFGEMLGIWCTHHAPAVQAPKFNIVELGPGRGTLLADMLRTIRSFPQVRQRINEIHLVEASPAMRKRQQAALCKPDTEVTPDGISVTWHRGMDTVPVQASYYLAHEFFDALPTHRFQYVKESDKPEGYWSEILVEVNPDLPPDQEPEFRLVRSKGATLESQTLSRFIDVPALLKSANEPELREGLQAEISPLAATIAQDIGDRLAKEGGAALFVDYGEDFPLRASLRAIHEHSFVADPLLNVGKADLSVDVDFSLLRRMIRQSKAEAWGPMTQGDFLRDMGIVPRTLSLIKNLNKTEAKEMMVGVNRLLDPKQMGRIYKVMAATPANQAPPFPFPEIK